MPVKPFGYFLFLESIATRAAAGGRGEETGTVVLGWDAEREETDYPMVHCLPVSEHGPGSRRRHW
jgi:hypothetical protein